MDQTIRIKELCDMLKQFGIQINAEEDYMEKEKALLSIQDDD